MQPPKISNLVVTTNVPKNSRRVAIVGGGLSGLTAAVKLHRADPSLDLTLYESADRVGGVIHTEQVDGFTIDHGADMFATEPSGVIELCRQIALDERLIEPEIAGRGARIVYRGRLVPVPEGFVVMRATRLLPVLTSPLLSLSGKLRFLAERWVKPGGQEDESIGDFVRRRMGKQVLDRIVAPLAAGIYTGDVDRLSMRATMGPIAELERRYGSLAAANAALEKGSAEKTSAGARYERFRSFPCGMIELVNGLAAALPAAAIRLNTPVQSIHRQGGQFRLTIGSPDASESVLCDRLIVATPASTAARLIRDLVPGAAVELAKIESTSTAIVVLGVRRSDIRKDISTFGFVVPPAERRRILAGSFASNKFAGRAPDGHVLIRCFIGGALQSELLDHSDEELISIARGELADLIGLVGAPIVSRVVRWDRAMPQYHVGHLDRVEKIQRAIAESPGLSLISNSLGGVGIAAVVRSADRIAAEVIDGFNHSRDTPGSHGTDAAASA